MHAVISSQANPIFGPTNIVSVTPLDSVAMLLKMNVFGEIHRYPSVFILCETPEAAVRQQTSAFIDNGIYNDGVQLRSEKCLNFSNSFKSTVYCVFVSS